MLKLCVTMILSVYSIICFAQENCQSAPNVQAMADCYMMAFQKSEQTLNQAMQVMRQILPKQEQLQFSRSSMAWRNYMMETCEFEARLYGAALRPVTLPRCQKHMTDQYTRYIADIGQKFKMLYAKPKV